ncbi:hypothetical protein FACS1894170_03740 [Planctomycetales bacterium]|nr:hypothetical protein FACS1894170_03740 [Planctomycetales bacterium]
MTHNYTSVLFSTFFVILCGIPAVFAANSSIDRAVLLQHIERWVVQLGDESYTVRQRAAVQILNAGLEAYPALQTAKYNDDIEIAQSAETLLGQIEERFMGQENPAVEYWLRQYTIESNPAQKARILRTFADIFSDLSNGEGLQTLCRIALSDDNPALRIEAAKCLLASPPSKPSLCANWYKTIAETFNDAANDDLLLLADYAKLRCDMCSGTVPDSINHVRDITKRIAGFQQKPEYSVFQPGNQIDILVYYAAAIVQDAAGLTEECNQNVAAALAVKPEAVRSSEPLQAIEEEDNWKMHEHYYAARWLRKNYRLRWALPHFDKTAAEGHIKLKYASTSQAAEAAVDLTDYAAAVRYCDKIIEIVSTDDYTKWYTNHVALKNDAELRRFSVLAEQAAESSDWDQVRKYADQGLQRDNTDINLLILAFRYCKEQSSVDDQYRHQIHLWVYEALQNINQSASPPSNDPDNRRQAAVKACNDAAWLLANTDGDYTLAKALIDTAVQAEPEELMYIDTLATVYALGKEYDKAIETENGIVQAAPEMSVFRKTLERFKRYKDTLGTK